jgi:S-adenosylmethionine decarboxylase
MQETSHTEDPHSLGWHWLVDFYECLDLPMDPKRMESLMVDAAKRSGATVVQSCFHQFSPHGLSGVVVIAESHLAVHTWPEHKAMCLDFFSCSDKILADKSIAFIEEQVQATRVEQSKLQRGNLLRY